MAGRLPKPGQFCFESLQVARYQDGQYFMAHEVRVTVFQFARQAANTLRRALGLNVALVQRAMFPSETMPACACLNELFPLISMIAVKHDQFAAAYIDEL